MYFFQPYSFLHSLFRGARTKSLLALFVYFLQALNDHRAGRWCFSNDMTLRGSCFPRALLTHPGENTIDQELRDARLIMHTV